MELYQLHGLHVETSDISGQLTARRVPSGLSRGA